jgi:hypothetical protein
MKVLSIDIGIKHLAHCLFEISDNTTILDWDVIDLTDENVCACSKPATHRLHQTYTCKKHSVPNLSMDELVSQCTQRSIPVGTKAEMKKALFKEAKILPPPTLVDLGQQIMKRYNTRFSTVDIVLIENQIGPLACKMKSVQGLVVQYWLMRGAKVECISACNKLKLFHTGKTTYAQRKKLSIHYTKLLLTLNELNTNFLTHKKKDDLADTFLQGVWYLQINNCGLLKINCS